MEPIHFILLVQLVATLCFGAVLWRVECWIEAARDAINTLHYDVEQLKRNRIYSQGQHNEIRHQIRSLEAMVARAASVQATESTEANAS